MGNTDTHKPTFVVEKSLETLIKLLFMALLLAWALTGDALAVL
jgi:hypothetical protein